MNGFANDNLGKMYLPNQAFGIKNLNKKYDRAQQYATAGLKGLAGARLAFSGASSAYETGGADITAPLKIYEGTKEAYGAGKDIRGMYLKDETPGLRKKRKYIERLPTIAQRKLKRTLTKRTLDRQKVDVAPGGMESNAKRIRTAPPDQLAAITQGLR